MAKNAIIVLQDLSKKSIGSAEPSLQRQLSISVSSSECRQKSSSEAPIARLESLDEAGTDEAGREARTPSIYKQRSSDV